MDNLAVPVNGHRHAQELETVILCRWDSLFTNREIHGVPLS